MTGVPVGGELLLAGGGDVEDDSWLLDRRLAERLDGPVVYLPAGRPEERHADATSALRSALASHGVGDVRTWSTLRDRSAADLEDAGAVYLGDGNAYRLLAALRRSDFDEALLAFVADGGILYGRGAGAAVCGHSVAPTGDDDVADLRDDAGLDLLEGWDVRPDYDPRTDDLRATVAETGRPVVGLTDRAGLSVTPDRCLAVGYEPVEVCEAEGKRRVLPEETFALG